ncbi:hypothetical protein HUT18_11730 [Streptomyces sp. NA04227]|uniref:DUF6884 domain-containing protein n=1 Tax=Streptomyces sp. NA04227 TaxID=2742136 RepID=UPI0015926CC7|nr:DUF6884 domain-containing protein [Streptomyces sp. NA04227]QKW06968.1 hypothetical protein HUT18_11730 [Streptomyces sp. NA04227]
MATVPPTSRTDRVYVIACSVKKLDHTAPARELYTGSYFRACWGAAASLAEQHDALVLVLSARHGLVTLDTELEPYDTHIGDRDAVSDLLLQAQARKLGVDRAREVTILAGAAYVQAARQVWPDAKAPLAGLGIGKQLQLLNELRGAAELDWLTRKAASQKAARSEKPEMPAAHRVDEVAERGPLYDLPYDYKQTARDFTVSVAGPGRLDGEGPFTYLVEEYTTEKAWAKVLAWFMVEQETVDVYVVAARSFEGKPEPGCGYFWTDLRPEFARQAALDDLADQAAEVVDGFHAATSGMVRDGDVVPDHQEAHDNALDEAQHAGWPLVIELAANDGR